MADALAVWLGSETVGTLRRGRRTGLEFAPISGARAISVGVAPGEAWTPARSTAWFEGLLPEGEARTRIASRFGIAAQDSFALLAEIGWECAGAISVLPAGRVPAEIGATYANLTDDEVGLRLDALPGRPYDADEAIRASLGGVQSKLVLARSAQGWAEPIDGAPSTHILKPEPPQWPGMAAAEGWAMTVASAVTETADVHVRFDLGQRPVVIVTRFDRDASDPRIRRRHQEDLCQILGLLPDAKYSEPPPKPWKASLKHLAATLLARAIDPPTELGRLLEQTVVNVALGNTDAHAKNHSIIHDDMGFVRLAPLYDVVPTVAFLPSQTHLALPVGGKYRLAEVSIGHLTSEGASWGLPGRLAATIVGDALGRLRDGVPVADRAIAAMDPRVRTSALAQIERLGASSG